MKFLSKNIFIISAALYSFFFLSGCKEKGCTNPQAINYNSVADEDDGSCILCQGTTDTLTTSSVDLYDNNFQSPHYNQVVGTFHLIQTKENYPYVECGTNKCHVLVNFENRVDKTMAFQCNVQCSSSGGISFSFQRTISAPSFQTTSLGFIPDANIFNPCLPILPNNLFCGTFGNISYIN